jgi:hypothetical protein
VCAASSQEHLEKNTEHLTELTEMPLAKINRTDLVNYTRVTQKVCSAAAALSRRAPILLLLARFDTRVGCVVMSWVWLCVAVCGCACRLRAFVVLLSSS